jgi:hypothetical protein
MKGSSLVDGSRIVPPTIAIDRLNFPGVMSYLLSITSFKGQRQLAMTHPLHQAFCTT